MLEGCTSGAKIIGDRYYLLKNRDLIWGGFRDTLVFEKDVFFITGINVSGGDFAGASYGFNRHGLAGCNTSVLITENNPDDLLLERILRETQSIEDAFEFVQSDLDNGTLYHWCNFILASPEGVGVIEIGDGVAALEKDPSLITRTNHHLLLPTADIIEKTTKELRGAAGRLSGSRQRRQDAMKMLQEATSTMDMAQLLSSHRDGQGFNSICRHLSENPKLNPYQGETVYSYILEALELDNGTIEFRLRVTPGNPCTGTYKEFKVDFDSPESKFKIISDYP
jgi:hypothetical protein